MIISSKICTLGMVPNEVDVVFLMGTSSPAGGRHLLNEKRLVEEIIKRNNTQYTRFAIVQYENTATVRLSLNDYTNPKKLLTVLNSLYWRGDASNLPSGLEKVKMLFENEGRLNARKILVILSDGKITSTVEDIQAEKELLEKKRIKIITVTVGDTVDEDKFNKLASKNKTIRHDDDQEPKNTGDKIQEEILNGMLCILYIYIQHFA